MRLHDGCHGSRGTMLENGDQTLNMEEKFALGLHLNLPDSPRKTSAPVKLDEITQMPANRTVVNSKLAKI